jgi:hypothetical protein
MRSTVRIPPSVRSCNRKSSKLEGASQRPNFDIHSISIILPRGAQASERNPPSEARRRNPSQTRGTPDGRWTTASGNICVRVSMGKIRSHTKHLRVNRGVRREQWCARRRRLRLRRQLRELRTENAGIALHVGPRTRNAGRLRG